MRPARRLWEYQLQGVRYMAIPLEHFDGEEKNVYEITCAAIRRAYQITITGDLEDHTKIVPSAISQILTQKVRYRLEE